MISSSLLTGKDVSLFNNLREKSHSILDKEIGGGISRPFSSQALGIILSAPKN